MSLTLKLLNMEKLNSDQMYDAVKTARGLCSPQQEAAGTRLTTYPSSDPHLIWL